MTRKVAVAGMVCCFGWSLAQAGFNRWTTNGPTGAGPIRVLAIDPQTPTTLYAGWAGQGGFGIPPPPADNVYSYGSGPGVSFVSVFKSSDGGASWSPTGLMNQVIYVLAVDPQTPATLYAGTRGGVFKSVDGGASWAEVNAGLGQGGFPGGLSVTWVRALAIDPQTPATLYAGTGGGVFKSVDGGASWTPMNAGLPVAYVQVLAIDPQTPTTLYAGIRPQSFQVDGGVFKSNDGGAHWTPMNAGLPETYVGALAIDPQSPATLYAGSSRPALGSAVGGVFKSSDGGASWRPISFGLTTSDITALAIDPQTPTNLYVGTSSAGVFKSSDGGASWWPRPLGLTNQRISALAVHPQTPATLYAGTGGGVFKSVDSAASWTAMNVGFNLLLSISALVVDPQTPATVYAGSDVGGVSKSRDGGASWRPMSFGLTTIDITALAVDPQTPTTVYAGTGVGGPFRSNGGGGVFKSNDGGANWTSTGLTNEHIWALAVDPETPTTLYAGGVVGVFKSNDGGANWTPTGLTNEHIWALAVDPKTPTTAYAGTFGGVFKSADGGASWTPMNAGLPDTSVQALAVDPKTPTTLYAGTFAGVFKSADGGASWTPMNAGLPDTSVLALAVDPQTPATLYAGTGGGVFKSVDGGASWAEMNAGLPDAALPPDFLAPAVQVLAIDPQTPANLYAGTRFGVFRFTTPQFLYFAQYGNGQGFTSMVMLNNGSETQTATGNVEVFDDDGNPLPDLLFPIIHSAGQLGTEEGQFSIPPRSSEVLMTDGQGELSVGSLRISSDLALNGNVIFSIPGVGTAGVAASPPLTGFIATVQNNADGMRSALALQNVGDYPITVTFLLRSRGEDVGNGTGEVQLPGGGHIARFVEELFPDAELNGFVGTIIGESEAGQFTAVVMNLGSYPGEFASLEVTPIP